MLRWLFMGALGSLLAANSSCIQDAKRDCKHNVFHRELNGRYQLDFKAAENLCRSLGTTLATLEQLKRAHAEGYERCRYGWIQEQLVALPRVHAHPSCAKNFTGVYTVSRPLSSKFDVFCYTDDCTLEDSPTDILTIPRHPVEIGKQNLTALSPNSMSTSLLTTTDLESTTVPLAEDRGDFTDTTVGAAGPFATVQTDPQATAVLPLSDEFTESASPSVRLARRTSPTAPGFTRKAILSPTRPEHLLNSLSGSPSTRMNTIEVVDGTGSVAEREPYTESTGQTPLTWDDHMTKPTSGTDFPTIGLTALSSPPSLPLDDSQVVNLGTEEELQANQVTEIPFSAEAGFATIGSTAPPSPLASDSSPILAATQEREEHTELVSEVASELELIKAEPHSDPVLMTTGSTTLTSPPSALVDNILRYNMEAYSSKDESSSLNSHSDPADFSEFQLSTEGDPESASGLFTPHRLTNLSFDPAAVTVLDTTRPPSSSPSSGSRGHPADTGNIPETLDFSPTEIRLDHSTGLSNELRLAVSASAETSVPFGESGSTSDILSSETQETATRFSQEITINTELVTEPNSQPPDINTKRTFDPPVRSTLQAVDFELTQSARPPDHSSAVAMPFVTTQKPVISTLPPSPEVPPIVPSTTDEKEELHEMVNQIEPFPHTTVQPKHTSPELSDTTEVYSTTVFGPTTSLPITTGLVYQVSSFTVRQGQKDLESTTVPLAEDRGVFTDTTVGAAGPFATVQTDPQATAVLPLSDEFTESASPSVRLARRTSPTAPGFTRKAILSPTRPEHLLNSLSGSPSTRMNTIEVVDGTGSVAEREPYTESTGQTPLTWDDHMTKPTSGTDFPTIGLTALSSPPSLPLDDSQVVNLGTEEELQANQVTEIPFSAEAGFATIGSTAPPSPLASDSSPTLAATQEREEHTELVSEVASELELIKAEPHSDPVLMTTGSTTLTSPPSALVDNILRYNMEAYSSKDESSSLNSHSDPADFSEFQLSTEGDPESASGLFTPHRLTNLSFDPAAVTVLDTTRPPSSSPSSESRGHPADTGNIPETLDFSPTEIRLDHSTGLSNELRLAVSASAETSVPFGESGSTSDILSSETQETATRFSQEITINTELVTEPNSQPPDINTKRTFDPPVRSTLQAVDFELTQSARPPDHSSAVAMPFVTTQKPVTSTLPPSPEVPPIVPSTTAKKEELHEMVNQIEPFPHTTVQPKHTSPELSDTTEVYSTTVFGPTTSLPITTGLVYQVSSFTVRQGQKAQPNITMDSTKIPQTEELPRPTAMEKKSPQSPLDWLIVAAIVVSLLIILLGGVMIIYSKRLCGRKKSLTITKPGEDGVTAMENGASNGRGEDVARQGELKAEAKASDEWIQLIDKNNLDIVPESTEAAKLMKRDESGELPNIEVTATTQDQVNWS